MSKAIKRVLLLFATLFALLLLFHHSLLLFACRYLLTRAQKGIEGSLLSYESLQWEEGAIVLRGLILKSPAQELLVDCVKVERPLCLTPRITIIHPQLTITSFGSAGTPLPLFSPSAHFRPLVTLSNGVLLLPSARFYFSLAEREGGVETLTLSHDPDSTVAPLLKADLSLQNKEWRIAFEIHESDLQRAAPLLPLLFSRREEGTLSGELDVEGEALFDSHLCPSELTLQWDAHHLEWAEGGFFASCPEATGEIVSSDKMATWAALCQVEGAEFSHPSGWGLKESRFSLQAEPEGKTTVVASGKWTHAALALPLDVDLNASFEREGEKVTYVASGFLLQDPFEANGSFVVKELSSLHLQECALQFPSLHPQLYTSALKNLLPSFDFQGTLQCEAVLLEERIQLTARSEGLMMGVPEGSLFLADSPLHFAYDWNLDRFSLEVPLSSASLLLNHPSLFVEDMKGTLRATKEKLEIADFAASCAGIPFEGEVRADFSGKELTLSTTRLDASAEQVCRFVHALVPSFPKEPFVSGDFHSGEGGLRLSVPFSTGDPTYTVRGMLTHLACPMGGIGTLSEGRADVAFHSQDSKFVLSQGEGKWDLADGSFLSLQAKSLEIDCANGASTTFSLSLLDGKKEVGVLKGGLQVSSGDLTLDSSSCLLGIPLQLQRCRFSSEGASFEMRPTFDAQQIPSVLLFLKRVGVLGQETNLQFLQDLSLRGTLQLGLLLDNPSEGLLLSALSSDFVVSGRALSPLQLSASLRGNHWKVVQLRAGDFTFKGSLVLSGEEVGFSQVEGSWQDLSFKGSGQLALETKELFCTLDTIQTPLPSLKGTLKAGARLRADLSQPYHLDGEANLLIESGSFTLSNKGPLHFFYEPETGLISETWEVQIREKKSATLLAEAQGAKLLFPKEGYLFAQGVQFFASPPLKERLIADNLLPSALIALTWESNLQASGDLQITPTATLFQGSLAPGRYGWNEKKLPFEQIQLSIDGKRVHVRAKTLLEKQPLFADLQLDCSPSGSGALKLFDHPKAEGLAFALRSQAGVWGIEGVEGSLYGLHCQLKAKKRVHDLSTLTGEVSFDFPRLLPLLSSSLQKGLGALKLGSGYTWKGEFTFAQGEAKGFSSVGTLVGEECELLGYHLGKMEAKVEVGPDRVLFTRLEISDPAGHLFLPKLEMGASQDQWQLKIPELELDALKPSLLRKVGSEVGVPKPFTIQHLTLTEITGKLSDLSTLDGSGYLTFSNQFKKESSLFDIPLEMIKKIGLDLSLLTPVEGELQVELKGDRFYLISLNDVFSEARRSEFYLSPSKHLSYIDLAGNVHIDLKMRQDVVLKVIEPFTLTVRGTLDKPRYGLQF